MQVLNAYLGTTTAECLGMRKENDIWNLIIPSVNLT